MQPLAWRGALGLLVVTAAGLAWTEETRPRSSLGIAPLEADLAAMRHTLHQLELTLNSGRPDQIQQLISPTLPAEGRQLLEQAVRTVMEQLGPGSRYYVRRDIGRGAVVPTAPDRVKLQVTGTHIRPEGSQENEALRLELEAVEQNQRRRWLVRELVFAGRAPLAPTPRTGPWGFVAAGLALMGLVGGILVALRRRGRRRG